MPARATIRKYAHEYPFPAAEKHEEGISLRESQRQEKKKIARSIAERGAKRARAGEKHASTTKHKVNVNSIQHLSTR